MTCSRCHKCCCRAALFTLTIFVVLSLSAVELFGQSCVTSQCHSAIAEHNTIHAPVAENACFQCHQKIGVVNHPGDEGEEYPLSGTGEKLCLQCHDSTADTYEHGPAASGACLMCHSPHGADHDNLLRKPLRELCLGCHKGFGDDMAKAQFVHSAIIKLDCSACHRPHSSEFVYLLKGEASLSCFACHQEIENKYRRSLHRHEPLYTGGQCANCHFAHYSDFSALLKREDNETCYHCHSVEDGVGNKAGSAVSQLAVRGKEHIHAPIENDGCSSCHDVHGSRFSFLLNDSYPGTFYAPFAPERYQLCFSCHDEDLLTERDKTTGFRNGEVNLHHLHVGDEMKGRTCKACHNLHASDGEKLINPDGIPFGNWKIPVRFKATETGGSCMPGCHRGMQYDRNRKTDNSREASEEESEKNDVLQPEPLGGILKLLWFHNDVGVS